MLKHSLRCRRSAALLQAGEGRPHATWQSLTYPGRHCGASFKSSGSFLFLSFFFFLFFSESIKGSVSVALLQAGEGSTRRALAARADHMPDLRSQLGNELAQAAQARGWSALGLVAYREVTQ